MKSDRRSFIRTGAGAAFGLAAGNSWAAPALDPAVAKEMEERLRYLTPPDGTPTLEATPSPKVTPFKDALLVPPTATPIIDFSRVGNDWPHADTPVEKADKKLFWDTFEQVFQAKATALRKGGIEIGGLPLPDAHQRFWDFRPLRFYVIWEREFPWQFHSEYGKNSWSWGFESLTKKGVHPACNQTDYNPNFAGGEPNDRAATCSEVLKDSLGEVELFASSPGPTFHAYYGEPILVRRINALPAIVDDEDARRRMGHGGAQRRNIKFAIPSTTTHLHNAHTASESDGHPNDWINAGEYWDHHYGNFPSGFDDNEKLSTLWYHDHRMDFTAANVYAGLDGFYFLFDGRRYEVELQAVAEKEELVSGGTSLVVVALVGGKLHIRLFDENGVERFDRSEAQLNGDGNRTVAEQLRKLLVSHGDLSQPLEGQRSTEVLNSALALLDHTVLADLNDENHGWGLPSGEFDVPLIFHDLLFAEKEDEQAHCNTSEGSSQLVFDGFNTDGIIGDRFTVNRVVQPNFKVKRRKYRFRLLNGGPSRFYDLFLHTDNQKAFKIYERQRKGGQAPGAPSAPAEAPEKFDAAPFIVIAGDGNLQPHPILARSIYIGVAQRVDVIIDFSAPEFAGRDHVYLVNRLEQTDGQGPSGRILEPEELGNGELDLDSFFEKNAVVRFDLEKEEAEDPSRFPLAFREFPDVDLTEVRRERLWEFDYDGGLWTINGQIYDPNRIDAGIEQDTAEIWTLRNSGDSWSHPIHSHFTEFIVLEINGVPQYQDSVQTSEEPEPAGTFDIEKNVKSILRSVHEKRAKPETIQNLKQDQSYGGREPKLESLVAAEQDEGAERYMKKHFFRSFKDFDEWIETFPAENLDLRSIKGREQGEGRFMGGSRRDVALLLPNWEVKVFMRWKDFLGKHVMHCHNVVHEDHAMMIRWDIVQPGKGFDTPKHLHNDRIPYVQPFPRRAHAAENDSDASDRR